MATIIKRVKNFGKKALIKDEYFRDFFEKFESEINRGISTLCILSVINESGEKGIYGYQILKELEDATNEMLVIEEGTLYPILKKLEYNGVLKSVKQKVDSRTRTYYSFTKNGYKIYNYLTGFFSKLIEAISPLFKINVELKERFFYCPNCANKLDLINYESNYCEICGLNIQELKKKV